MTPSHPWDNIPDFGLVVNSSVFEKSAFFVATIDTIVTNYALSLPGATEGFRGEKSLFTSGVYGVWATQSYVGRAHSAA